MPRPSDIRSIIEQAVAQGLEAALPGLRDDIVARATEAVEGVAQSKEPSPTALLSGAATHIQEGNSQAEILRYLLDGCSRFAARVALFVVKGGTVTGWQGNGFENNELLKGTNLSAGRGLMTDAIGGRVPAAGKSSDFDAGFLAAVKSPAEDACLVLPLVVKDKAAALIYADGGTEAEGGFDASALSVLTRFAALCLETGTRKGDSGLAPVQEYESASPVVASAAASAAMPAAASAPAPPAAAPAPQTFSSADEADLHKKAKRFAKLLVEEIMLYNQAKVAQGKKNQDLYTRLREDIEKSRATYDKRYGESAVASANYFNQELIRILADNDVSLMGDGFPR
jgi:hypothetical protein